MHQGVQTTVDTGSPLLSVTNSRENYNLLTVRGLADQLDNINFPREGYAGSFEILSSQTALGSDASFSRGVVSGQAYTSWGPNTVSGAVKVGGRLGNDPIPLLGPLQLGRAAPAVGLPHRRAAGRQHPVRAPHLAAPAQDLSILDGVYGGASFEVGRVGKPLIPGNEQGTLKSIALLLGVDTPIGPLYLGWGHTQTGINSGYLYLATHEPADRVGPAPSRRASRHRDQQRIEGRVLDHAVAHVAEHM